MLTNRFTKGYPAVMAPAALGASTRSSSARSTGAGTADVNRDDVDGGSFNWSAPYHASAADAPTAPVDGGCAPIAVTKTPATEGLTTLISREAVNGRCFGSHYCPALQHTSETEWR